MAQTWTTHTESFTDWLNRLLDWFRRKINLARKYLGKKILHWKKYLSWWITLEKKFLHCCMSGKNVLSPEVWGKKFSPKPNHPLKSQMVGPCKKLKGYITQTSMPGNIVTMLIFLNYSHKRYYYVIPVLWKCHKMSVGWDNAKGGEIQ